MTDLLLLFMLGMAVTACAVIGAFFLRFWSRTRDRLFLAFASAFWLFGANWAMLAILKHEEYPGVYVFRLVGFSLILIGIVGKNRSRKHGDAAGGASSPISPNQSPFQA